MTRAKVYEVSQNAIDPNWNGYNAVQVVRYGDHKEVCDRLERALDLLDILRTWEYYESEHLDALDQADALLKEVGYGELGEL
jgi:hypothetical protein